MQTPDDKPPSPLLAMDPDVLQLVWASCTFGAKAALACTCRELQQQSQAWQWGMLPSQRWRSVAHHWWLSHRKLAWWGEGFVVQPPVSMERQGDYEAARKVQAAWEPGRGRSYHRTGLPEFGFDPVTSRAARLFPVRSSIYIRDIYIRDPLLMLQLLVEDPYLYTFQVISSPMLLYRLRCLFPSCEVKKFNGYLSVWNVSLRHKRTRYQADFEDCKGGVIAGADPSMHKDEAATQDLLDLIELLCSDRCPHPYDGLVAGCVA